MELFYKDDIQKLFSELLFDVKCEAATKSYLISIYSKYRTSEFDYSKDSITLLYGRARDQRDFSTFQGIGDYVFWSITLYPEHLKHADKSYYRDVARLSYHSCYQILNRQWQIYNELADSFILLENQVKVKLKILL